MPILGGAIPVALGHQENSVTSELNLDLEAPLLFSFTAELLLISHVVQNDGVVIGVSLANFCFHFFLHHAVL